MAALTLPTIITKQRNSELEGRFKTAYSLISQAVLRMAADNADIAETYCSKGINGRKSYEFIEDFSKYFQKVKILSLINNSEHSNVNWNWLQRKIF